jgi:enamine deaminase RidA (YjgF/YER057c/UK114 family)
MPKEFINPPAISTPTGYTHAVSARGQRIIYISGQVAVDRQGNLVGPGDLRAQAQQVFENVKAALSAAGVTFADVVKLNTYIVNYTPANRAVIREVREQYVDKEHPPASTLVGVQALAVEGLLIEIEAVAITD